MKPKEKADDLIESYYNLFAYSNQFTNLKDALAKKTKAAKMAVKGAGMAVEELLAIIDDLSNGHSLTQNDYWKAVKEFIDQLWLELITPTTKK
jgi:hypothetical protein